MDYSDRDKILLWQAMCLGIGSGKFFKLMDYYGDIDDIWNNFNINDSNLNFLSVKEKTALDKTKDLSYVNKCIEKWKNPKFTTLFSENYPSLLKEIVNPPLVLFYIGAMRGFENSIAIVGSRKCTKYGLDCAFKFAQAAADKGITVVSGGARGIDTRAHQGALNGGGRTACVLGCGIDIVYPPENAELFKKIIDAGGVILSEYFPGEAPSAWHFPERNRIISGMTSGVLVVEAGEKSGALITAQIAIDENREVFSIPGNIYSPASIGTNRLIKGGATPVDCFDDIMFQFGWSNNNKNIKKSIDIFSNLDDTEKNIAQLITKNGSISIDELCELAGMGISELNSVITMMEISGVIKRKSGNILTI